MERHFATVWESVADEVGDDIAVVQGATRRTWTELDDRAARLAAALVAAGVAPGTAVAQYLYNSPEYLETTFAAFKVRAVPVNVNYRYLDDELLHLLEDSEARVMVFHASLGDRVARVLPRARHLRLAVEVDDVGTGTDGATVDGAVGYEALLATHDPAPRIARSADDLAMTYTGGTTGLPKGVMSKVGNGVDATLSSTPVLLGQPPVTDPAGAAGLARVLADADARLVGLPACPLMHATGLSIGAIPALSVGGTVALLAGRGLDVDELWDLVDREGVMALTVVGDAFARPMLRGLREGPPRSLASLRAILSSGAMFSTEVKQGLLDHLPDGAYVLDFIASTEGTMGTSISVRDRPAPTGHFTPSAGVKVFDEHDREVVPGSGQGGIVAVPGAIPVGYFKDPAKTARTFREVDGVTYSFPGDWATVGADGSLTLLGRGSQCINTGGEKVFPEEVEEAIKRLPTVDDALVFGVPDERFGQRVVAVVSAAPGAPALDVDALVADLRAHLSAYKVPRSVVLVDEVPRAPNGKADYPGARARFEAAG
ncbi:MAG: AMP-binding protein [Actinobacteria bacterium]|nr:AMP-binding protein [Actinomycetota bacterium]